MSDGISSAKQMDSTIPERKAGVAGSRHTSEMASMEDDSPTDRAMRSTVDVRIKSEDRDPSVAAIEQVCKHGRTTSLTIKVANDRSSRR